MEKRSGILSTALAIGVAVAIAGSVGADEGVFLGYNFAEGHSQEYKVKLNYEVDYGGFAMSQMMDMEVTEKCVGVEEEKFLMEMVFNKVEAARMQFDNMVEDPTGESLTGQSVTFSVNKFGEAEDIKPTGYIEGWGQIKPIIESVVESWFAYLPNETVAEGGGWTKEEEPEEGATLVESGSSKYKFEEVKKESGRECAKIVAESKTAISGKTPTQMGTMSVEGEAKGEVEFFFCMKSSTIVKYKAKFETKQDMTPEAGGDTTEMTINGSLERELKS